MRYTTENLVIRPARPADDPGLLTAVTPERAGWDTIRFEARRLEAGQSWACSTPDEELAIVPLGGRLSVDTNHGRFGPVGGRVDVFAGLPHALYLPRGTSLTATALTDCEFAIAWAHTEQVYAPKLVTPGEIATEIRGGDHATRQINSLLPPGFPCARLVLVEVYTPGGNWSSYPPHKHDVHNAAADGRLLEADLDEIYFYKFDKPEGFAFQRIYTDPTSPLARAGEPIDAVVTARENDVVLIPEGYHPVTCPVGYTAYYLNVLVGSAQSLAATDDPAYAWVKDSYQTRDPRVPLYPTAQGAGRGAKREG
ncbi:MAG: 5-deoxy-glucuronate isomerase [Anaerolineales bacterium]|nr:5-deoxy-glucuronate isomerase [Anaerolineales bacterium]